MFLAMKPSGMVWFTSIAIMGTRLSHSKVSTCVNKLLSPCSSCRNGKEEVYSHVNRQYSSSYFLSSLLVKKKMELVRNKPSRPEQVLIFFVGLFYPRYFPEIRIMKNMTTFELVVS